jgi:hypothetical protein
MEIRLWPHHGFLAYRAHGLRQSNKLECRLRAPHSARSVQLDGGKLISEKWLPQTIERSDSTAGTADG